MAKANDTQNPEPTGPEFTVLEPLEHDGQPFLPGETITTLTDEQADVLLGLGVIGYTP